MFPRKLKLSKWSDNERSNDEKFKILEAYNNDFKLLRALTLYRTFASGKIVRTNKQKKKKKFLIIEL